MRQFTALEIGDDIAVSFAGRMLAAYGFRVICAEAPTGHRLRQIDGVWPAFGSGKQSLAIDLSSAAQLARLGDLAAQCDVVLDGLAASRDPSDRTVRTYVRRRMALASGGRALVSVTPFGLTGSKSDWRTNPFITYHAGGDAYFLPPGPGVERRAPVAAGDLIGEGMIGWIVAGAALAFGFKARQAASYGRFVHIDISKQEALLDLSRVELSRFANQGLLESRMTKGYETGGLQHTRDRPIVVMPVEDQQWKKMFDVMGNPEWSRDPALATRAGRRVHAAELQDRLQEWCLNYTAEEAYHLCQRAGVPAGIVKGPAEVFASRQSRHRGFFQEVVDEDGAKLEIPSLPMPSPAACEIKVPKVGEHSATVGNELDSARGPQIEGRWSSDETASENHEQPLAGLRVLDLSLAWSGPHASEALALLGADVVKVESERRLDLNRPADGIETTIAFHELNLNKRSIRLDLKHPSAQTVAHRLVAAADVLLDNFRPGVMGRLGLSWEVLSAINPRLIMASISSFGGTGEEAGYSGYGWTFGAMAGIDDLTGYPDWEPAIVRSPTDLTVGNATAALILAALLERQQTGRGRFLDISATDVMSALIPVALMKLQKEGKVLERRGNEGDSAFQGCYPCRGEDEWVAISAEDDTAVQELGKLLKQDLRDCVLPPEHRAKLASIDAFNQMFNCVASVCSRGDDAHAAISAWTSWQDSWALAELLQTRGVLAHPTSSPSSEPAEEHLRMRGAITNVTHPVQGKLISLSAPWRQVAAGGTGRPAIRPGPLLGQHTHEVLSEWLSIDETEFNALEADGLFK